jgi:hypothetical protein
MSFIEQMANIGSDVERALNWRTKNSSIAGKRALDCAFELLDLTIESSANSDRREELISVREKLVDHFLGANKFKTTDEELRKYFFDFAYEARKNY